MEIEISPAEHSDLDQLADLLSELFALENDFHPDREKQLRGLRLILENPALGRLFVLRDQGRVAVLEDVIVRGEYRGKGLGRRLVEHALAWAGMEGMTRVTLLADRDNKAALDFYRKLGFEHSHMVVLRRRVVSSLRAPQKIRHSREGGNPAC